jgi:hypothetical protein
MPDYRAQIHEIPDSTSTRPAGGPENLSGQSCESAAMASKALNFSFYLFQHTEEDNSEVQLFSVSLPDLSTQLAMDNIMVVRMAYLQLILNILLLTS